jgi:hypothetical protein
MWFQVVSKRGLGEALERPGEARPALFDGSESIPIRVPSGQYVVLWHERTDRAQAPAAIVVEDEDRRDLLAWAASFATSYRPLTAHVRVLNPETCAAFLAGRPRMSSRWVAAAVGAILGEASAASTVASLPECASTYSYAMGRTFALGLHELFGQVSSAWQAFSSLTGRVKGRQGDSGRRAPWKALAAAVARPGSHSQLDSSHAEDGMAGSVRVLRDLFEAGVVREATLASLQQRWPALQSMLRMLGDTRETRVSAFHRFADELAQVSQGLAGDGELAFVLGYLASRLSPGRLEYLELLKPLEGPAPQVLVWYGICAALQGNDFISASGGLGRRIHRDLSAAVTFPERPRADLSVWDLELFSKSEAGPTFAVRGRSLEVELLPDVVCVASDRGRPSQAGLFYGGGYPEPDTERLDSIRTGELKTLAEELRLAVDRMASVQFRLDKLAGPIGSSQPTRTRRR